MRSVLPGLCSLRRVPDPTKRASGWLTGVLVRAREGFPLWRRSSRVQISLVVFGMALVGMAAAGGFAYTAQATRIAVRVDESLTNAVGELHVLAAEGVDPQTGQPFASPERLLAVMLSREVTYENEGIVGLVDGVPAYTSPKAALRLEDDHVLVAQLELLVEGDAPEIMTVDTPVTQYRIVLAPIIDLARTDGADPSAALVVGFDMNRELAQVRNIFQAYFLIAAIALVGIALAS